VVKVILKGLKILEIVSANGNNPVRLSELAQKLGENPSTVAGIVRTLTEAGYLQKNPVRGYHLGIMATTLTHSDLYQRNLLLAANKYVTEFAVRHGLHLSLSVLRDNVRHTIMEVSDLGEMVMQARANAGVMNSATGLMLLSHEPRHKQDEILGYYGLPRHFTSYEDFMRYLDEIKRQGYVEISRPVNRVAIGVPVWYEHQVVAGLGVFLTVAQRKEWDINKVVTLLSDMSARITHDMEQIASLT
jgi:DNA-binding IclR family transcriptional regulator